MKAKIQPADQAPPLASFDLGNAWSKIKTADVADQFRSISGLLSSNRSFGEQKSKLVFTFEGETLVFGDDTRDMIDGDPTAYTDLKRYTEGFYRKLFAAALWRSFRDVAPDGVIFPRIVCSIPVVEYADGKADEVKKNIAGEYTINGLDGVDLYAKIEPSNVIIVPEGAGSYFKALYAPNSGIGVREVAVIDVGFYTTDLVIFNKGSYVTGSAQSSKHGVKDVADIVYKYLRRKEGYEGDMWHIDNKLEEGCIDIGARCVGFTDARDIAYSNLWDSIYPWYRSVKGSRTPNIVLLSGGGSRRCYDYVADELRHDGWQVVSGDARRANVDGDWLFLVERQKAGKDVSAK